LFGRQRQEQLHCLAGTPTRRPEARRRVGVPARPKNKTLEIFGQPYEAGGQVKHRPFHSYKMKQAIQEGFVLDVLNAYTTVNSYYKLVKTVEGDPEFDTKRAKKK